MTTEPRPYQTDNNDEAFTALLDEYAHEAQKVAELREAYHLLSHAVGKNHVTTKAAWNLYIDRDACLQPLSVKIGQMSMRRQMDSMSPDEFESFHRNND